MILNLDDYRAMIDRPEIEHPDLGLGSVVDQWQGATPYKAAQLIVKEFNDHFPGSNVFPVDSTQANPLGLTSGSWRSLEERCRIAARASANHPEYCFWDQMRGAIYRLERPKKRTERAALRAQELYQNCRARAANGERISDSEMAETVLPVAGVGVCQYCWRAVPYRQGENPAKLRCHQHSDKGYDQKKRAQLRKQGEEMGIFPASGHFFEIPEVMRAIPERSGLDAFLPHLPNVLDFLIASGLKLADPRQVIMTLEGAIAPEPKDIAHAREMFYVECALAPVWYRQNFLWAEAWLKLEATLKDNRGGKRPCAGRPRKNT